MHALEEYIWIVLRELWFLFLVLDNHNNRQQQTKTRKLNFCLVFVVGGGLFLSAVVSTTRPSHYPLMQQNQMSVSPSSSVNIQLHGCFIKVTAESEQKTFVYQGHIHSKDFGKFHLTRQGGFPSEFTLNKQQHRMGFSGGHILHFWHFRGLK